MSTAQDFYSAAFSPILAKAAREERPVATATWPALNERAHAACRPMTAAAWQTVVEGADAILAGTVQP